MTSTSFAEIRGAARSGPSGTRFAHGRAWRDGRRPRASAPMHLTPGGRPRQPAGPIVDQSGITWNAVGRRRVAAQQMSAPEWRLTDAGLALVMVSFALAIGLGVVVVVSQYLAIGAVG